MADNFKKYILTSIVVHIVVMFFLFFSPSLQLKNTKTYKVTWIQLSKGDGGTNTRANYKNNKKLPSSTVKEQKKAIRKLAKDKKGKDLLSHKSKTKKTVLQKWSQKQSSDNGGININKKKKKKVGKNQSLMNNALARIDQQLKQRPVDLSAGQAKPGESGQSQYGSNKGTTVDPALLAYYNTIKRKINREWTVSKSEFTGSLVAKIIVMIDANGNILRSKFKKASGDGSFDASAMRAIRRTAPFPIPPNSIRKEALTEGFLIEFNPQKVSGRM
jgi:colicin import membrane protein